MTKQRMKSAERHATSLGMGKKRKVKSGQGLGVSSIRRAGPAFQIKVVARLR